MPAIARPLTRLFALACAASCAAGCGTDPLPGALEQANIVGNPGGPPMGYRWDPHWDRVLPDTVLTSPMLRPISAPAMVLFKGQRYYFYTAARGNLAYYLEGFWTSITTDETAVGAPAAVVADDHVDIFFRTSGDEIAHMVWNGVYKPIWPGGPYAEIVGTNASSAPGASVATLIVPIYIWGTTFNVELTRVDVYYDATSTGVTDVHRVGAGAWTAPESLGDRATSAPAAVSFGPGRLDLFWRAPDKTIQHKWFDGACAGGGAGCWYGPEPIMTDAESAPTAASWGWPRLDVFAVRSDGGLYHAWHNGYGWRAAPTDRIADCVHTVNIPAEHDSAGASSYGTTPIRIDLAIWGTDGNFWHESYGYGALDTPADKPTCGCGGNGALCCDGSSCGPGLVCGARNLCGACGGAGQVCCAASACNVGLSCSGGTCATPPPPPPPPASKWDLAYDNVFFPQCGGCHQSGANKFLVAKDKHASYTLLRGYLSKEAAGAPLIVQPTSAASYLYKKLTGDPSISGVPMPKDAYPTDATSIGYVRDWIDSGAGE